MRSVDDPRGGPLQLEARNAVEHERGEKVRANQLHTTLEQLCHSFCVAQDKPKCGTPAVYAHKYHPR